MGSHCILHAAQFQQVRPAPNLSPSVETLVPIHHQQPPPPISADPLNLGDGQMWVTSRAKGIYVYPGSLPCLNPVSPFIHRNSDALTIGNLQGLGGVVTEIIAA